MPKRKKLTFDMDPLKGAANALVGLDIEGMGLAEMRRKGNKVICIYEEVAAESGIDPQDS